VNSDITKIKALVGEELARIRAIERRNELAAFLREPRPTTLGWDYGAPDERVPVWIVAQSTDGEDTLVYAQPPDSVRPFLGAMCGSARTHVEWIHSGTRALRTPPSLPASSQCHRAMLCQGRENEIDLAAASRTLQLTGELRSYAWLRHALLFGFRQLNLGLRQQHTSELMKADVGPPTALAACLSAIRKDLNASTSMASGPHQRTV
jgi:hypothetical protein